MHWMLIGYMFLFIHRPFEVWPILGDWRIERIYMVCTLIAWLLYPGKRWIANFQHWAYLSFALAVLFAWLMSRWMAGSQPIIEDWFKIVVFYFLLVTTVWNERALKQIVVGFMVVMALYLTHSFREYLGGRHTYRMGISRMIGVDTTMGDPNSFGATIVFVLPFIALFWRTAIGGRLGKLALLGYFGLSVLCILLTGSRSSLLGLTLWLLILFMQIRRKWSLLVGTVLIAPIAFMMLPESMQTRFETIIDPEVGPANAQESGQGRIDGFLIGMKLWGNNPISGVGPGAWRPATGSTIESHNLYGQLAGELGTLGVCAFTLMLFGFWFNWRRVRQFREETEPNDFLIQLANAVGIGVVLLLFMGNFGHNLFRYSWLWYGGFLIIARFCIEQREPIEWIDDDEGFEDDPENEDEPSIGELPSGWRVDPGHSDEAIPYHRVSSLQNDVGKRLP